MLHMSRLSEEVISDGVVKGLYMQGSVYTSLPELLLSNKKRRRVLNCDVWIILC